MDIVSLTQSKRAEILAYVKPRVSFESYSWIFNVFNDLNKKILFENDEVLAVKVYPMYENLISFIPVMEYLFLFSVPDSSIVYITAETLLLVV